jgi:AcrR family transcriptional regulator
MAGGADSDGRPAAIPGDGIPASIEGVHRRTAFVRPSDVQPDLGPPARSRMTASQRRSTILRAARGEFARIGYHGASTARIAAASSCSEPMLYKHFAGKLALFCATLEEVSTIVEEDYESLIDAPGDMLENCRAFLGRAMHDPSYVEMMKLRKLAVTLAGETQVAALLLGITERHLARVGRAVERARADGCVRRDVDPEYVAWMWSSIMQAATFRSAIEDDGFAAMLEHADRFLEGLRA